MALLFLILISITLILLAHKLYHHHLRFKLPPGPRPLPVVGNLYDIQPVRFRCFSDWSKKYGPIFSVYFGSQLNVVVTTAELAKQVLKENDQNLADRFRTRPANNLSRNGMDLIWADYGPHYVKVRKLCNLELFTPKRLEALRPIREDEVTAMVENIYKDCTKPDNAGKSLLMREYLGSVAFNNITRLTFGKRFMNSAGEIDEQGQEFKGIVSNGIKIGGKLPLAEYVPWLRWFFSVENEALVKHSERRDRLTRIIMDEHTLARKQTGDTKQHFVDALLTLQKQYDLSDDTVIGLLWRTQVTVRISLTRAYKLAYSCPVIDQNFYYAGLKFTSPTFSCAMSNMLPAMTFVMAVLCRMEKVHIKKLRCQAKVVGTIVTVAGAMLMTLYKGHVINLVWSNNVHTNSTSNVPQTNEASDKDWVKGSMLLIGATFAWASFFILQAITMRKYTAPLSLTTLVCFMGTLQSIAVTLVMEHKPSAWAIGFDMNLLAAAYAGIISSSLAYYVQGLVMEKRGPVFVTAFSPLMMIIVAIMGSFILSEKIYLGGVLGAVLIVAGLYSVLWGKYKEYQEKEIDGSEILEPVKGVVINDIEMQTSEVTIGVPMQMLAKEVPKA